MHLHINLIGLFASHYVIFKGVLMFELVHLSVNASLCSVTAAQVFLSEHKLQFRSRRQSPKLLTFRFNGIKAAANKVPFSLADRRWWDTHELPFDWLGAVYFHPHVYY